MPSEQPSLSYHIRSTSSSIASCNRLLKSNPDRRSTSSTETINAGKSDFDIFRWGTKNAQEYGEFFHYHPTSLLMHANSVSNSVFLSCNMKLKSISVSNTRWIVCINCSFVMGIFYKGKTPNAILLIIHSTPQFLPGGFDDILLSQNWMGCDH